MKKTAIVCTAGLIYLALAGCGKPQFPEAPVRPVKGFSLGTAQVQSLGKRPTAEEVYNAAVALYDSLGSAASTCNLTETMTSGWAEAVKRPADLADKPTEARVDFRFARPDKILVKRTGDEPVTIVQNRVDTIIYRPDEMTYEHRVTPRNLAEALPPSVPGWLQFIPPGDRQVEMKLAPDMNVGGTDAYALEIRIERSRVPEGELPFETRTFYLGKEDLLPRRIEIRRTLEAPKGGDTASDKVSFDFTGFAANVEIPDACFSTKPPKGAKEKSAQ